MNLSLRTIAILVTAIVMGLLAIFAVNQYVNSNRPAAVAPAQVAQTPQGAGTPVVVAATKIERGIAIQPQNLKVVNYPSTSVPDGTFTTIDQLTGDKAGQRVAMRAMVAGEPLLKTQVSLPGGHLNLSGIITPGMQAVTIRSNELSGVAGFVLPGDHVDVLMTRPLPPIDGKQPETVTQILAQDVKVLGVDQSTDENVEKPIVSHVVTVEVTSSQAQSITLGQAVGTVSLSLRHVTDPMHVARRGTVSSQFGYNATKGEADLVRVSRGSETIEFPLSPRAQDGYVSSTNPEARHSGARVVSAGSRPSSKSTTWKPSKDGEGFTATTTEGDDQ